MHGRLWGDSAFGCLCCGPEVLLDIWCIIRCCRIIPVVKGTGRAVLPEIEHNGKTFSDENDDARRS